MLEQTIEKGFEQVWQMFKETDKKLERLFAKTSRQQEETAQQLRETDKKVEGYFAETSRQQEETAHQLRETDKKLEKYFGKVRELDKNWGKLVETLVKPSVAQEFQKRGIAIVGSGQRVERHRNGETIEIDILLTNTDVMIVVEVKTTLSVDDVNEHIDKHLKPFKRFFTEYQSKKIYGAVAYIHVEEKADRYAYKKELFVLGFTANNLVTIKNDSKFIPKIWE